MRFGFARRTRLLGISVGGLALSVSLSAGAWAIEINTPDQLIALSGDEVVLDSNYTLTAAIDLSQATVSLPEGATSFIGGASNPFLGTFDGGGFVISGLSKPLFDSIGNGSTAASVSNLTLKTDVIEATSNTGALARTLTGNSTVSDVHVSGKIAYSGTDAPSIGGLVGSANAGSTIDQSTAVVAITSISGSPHIGGLVGDGYGTITNSAAAGNITNTGGSATYMGGLVGYLNGSGATVVNSSADVAVTSLNVTDRTGGLIGFANEATHITNSFASGTVSSQAWSCTGGLIGCLDRNNTVAYNISSGNINVSSIDNNIYGVGGLIGGVGTGNIISNNIAAGDIRVTASLGSAMRIGGLIGSVDDYANDITFDSNSGSVEITSALVSDDGGVHWRTSASQIGGSIGYVAAGNTVANDMSSSSITVIRANSAIGGLVGLSLSNISQSSSSGAVSAAGGTSIGGLVGSMGGDISHSMSSSSVSGTDFSTNYIGGLAGMLDGGFYSFESSGNSDYPLAFQWNGYAVVVVQDSCPAAGESHCSGHLGTTDLVIGTPESGVNLLNATGSAWTQEQFINHAAPYIKILKKSGFYSDTTPPPARASFVRAIATPINQIQEPQKIGEQKITDFLSGRSTKPTPSDFKSVGIIGVTTANLPILLKLLKDKRIIIIDPVLIAKQIEIANALLAKQKKAKQALKIKKASFESLSWTSFIPSLLLG
jgi:hypothetical protein